MPAPLLALLVAAGAGLGAGAALRLFPNRLSLTAGGVALAVGAAVGAVAAGAADERLGLVVALAALAAVPAALELPPMVTRVATVVSAAGAVAVGVRTELSAVAASDVVVTILWILAVSEGYRLMSGRGRVAAVVGGVAAGFVWVLAALEGEPAVAACAAGVVGACAGVLMAGERGSHVLIGDAGGIFLGFVLACLCAELPAGAPQGAVAPTLILAIPLVEALVVGTGRLLRGEELWHGEGDRLWHRLRNRGLTRSLTWAMLLGSQLAFSVAGLLIARRAVDGRWTTALAAAALAGLVWWSVGSLPNRAPSAWRLPRRGAALGVVALAAVCVLPATVALLRAYRSAQSAQASLERVLDAPPDADTRFLASELAHAEQQFGSARRDLHGPLSSLGLVVPGLSTNLETGRRLAALGETVAHGTGEVVRSIAAGRLSVQAGAIPATEIRRLADPLARAGNAALGVEHHLSSLPPSALLPPLRRAVEDLRPRLVSETQTLQTLVRTARLLPDLLGEDRPRRYFLAFQNNAELRGAGGFMGNWGELRASSGHLELTRFGRLLELIDVSPNPMELDMAPEFFRRWGSLGPSEGWTQANVAPDFPTTGRVLSQLYPQAGGEDVDGVIALDVFGLAALLETTGPVSLPAWPEPIGPDNLAAVTMSDAYERFPIRVQREAFLDALAREVVERFTSSELADPRALLGVLSRAVEGRHLQVWLRRPVERALIRDLHADGRVVGGPHDALLVVNQNQAANKTDYYLDRRLTYRATLHPGSGDTVQVNASVLVSLANGAPASGLSSEVIGPYDDRYVAGENRTHLSVYTSLHPGAAQADGGGAVLRQRELGLGALSTVLSIPSRSERSLRIVMRGVVDRSPDGWYQLDLPHQPSVRPDDVRIELDVPPPWRIAEVEGAPGADAHRLVARFRLDADHTVRLRLERPGFFGLLDRVQRDQPAS